VDIVLLTDTNVRRKGDDLDDGSEGDGNYNRVPSPVMVKEEFI